MFYLFANCNFIPDHYGAWQAAYDDLAAHVEPHEPSTQTYYFGIPLDYAHDLDATTSMFAFEVYGRREDLYETHLNSTAMTKFLTIIPAHTTTDLDLNHYAYLAGFLDRDGDRRECSIMLDQRIRCKSATARSTLVPHLKTLASTITSTERDNPSGVLTFMAVESLDDDEGARIYARFETREAMEAFLRRGEVDAFWQAVKGEVRGMEQRAYLPNGKGWLHRGGGTVETGKGIARSL